MKHLKSYKKHNESLIGLGVVALSLFGIERVLALINYILKKKLGKIPDKWLEVLTCKDKLNISVSEFEDRFFIRLMVTPENELDFRLLKHTKTLITPTDKEVEMTDSQYESFLAIIKKYTT